MATTINLELKKAPTSVGTYPVYIRITRDKKHKRIITSVALQKIAHWNPKGAKNNTWVRSGERDAAKLNEALAKELDAVRELYREDKGASVDALAIKVKNQGASASFLAFAIEATDNLIAQGKSMAKHYGTLCKKLEGFLAANGQKDLAFSDLSPALLMDFEGYLRQEKSQKNSQEGRRLSQNYIRTLLKKFETLVFQAIKKGKMPAEKNPFGKGKYEKPKEGKVQREALEVPEYTAIVALEYPAGSWLWHTKNAFVFSCNCGGIRTGDLLRLRWENISEDGSSYKYTMGKTGDEAKGNLAPDGREVLALYRTDSSKPSDYIFPFLDSSATYSKYEDRNTMPVGLKKALDNQIYSKNTLLNRYLKQIAKDAGIEKRLSMHIARHTFASIAWNYGASASDTKNALGHKSMQTTDKYLHSLENNGKNSANLAFAKATTSKGEGEENQTIIVSAKMAARIKELMESGLL